MSKVSKLEQETTINYNNEEKTCEIFTYDKRLINKLRKRGVDLKDINGDGSYFCVLPKRWIKVSPPKQVSAEAAAAFAKRVKEARVEIN